VILKFLDMFVKLNKTNAAFPILATSSFSSSTIRDGSANPEILTNRSPSAEQDPQYMEAFFEVLSQVLNQRQCRREYVESCS